MNPRFRKTLVTKIDRENYWNVRMVGNYLEQFWITHWTSRWEEREPVVEGIFERLNVLKNILEDV